VVGESTGLGSWDGRFAILSSFELI